jgi:hypothetical protein
MTYTTNIVRVTLTRDAPADGRSGLRLLSVDTDGTAHIEWLEVGKVIALHADSPTNQISLWTLDATDPTNQTARLHSFLCDGGK